MIYQRRILSRSQLGMFLKIGAKALNCHGNITCLRFFLMDFTITDAAFSALTIKGMADLFVSVKGVLT